MHNLAILEGIEPSLPHGQCGFLPMEDKTLFWCSAEDLNPVLKFTKLLHHHKCLQSQFTLATSSNGFRKPFSALLFAGNRDNLFWYLRLDLNQHAKPYESFLLPVEYSDIVWSTTLESNQSYLFSCPTEPNALSDN